MNLYVLFVNCQRESHCLPICKWHLVRGYNEKKKPSNSNSDKKDKMIKNNYNKKGTSSLWIKLYSETEEHKWELEQIQVLCVFGWEDSES